MLNNLDHTGLTEIVYVNRSQQFCPDCMAIKRDSTDPNSTTNPTVECDHIPMPILPYVELDEWFPPKPPVTRLEGGGLSLLGQNAEDELKYWRPSQELSPLPTYEPSILTLSPNTSQPMDVDSPTTDQSPDGHSIHKTCNASPFSPTASEECHQPTSSINNAASQQSQSATA